MALAFFRSSGYRQGADEERPLESVSFDVYKFNHRPKPKNSDRILIVGCFSEFGCETLGTMYGIPRLLRRYPGKYVIGIGWHGREYLYRHLVDEFWEIKQEHMWLREYVRAFHHISLNLKRIERRASKYGLAIPSNLLGHYVISNFCRTCGQTWQEWKEHASKCPRCQSTVVVHSLFTDIQNCKKTACRVPRPSAVMMEWAKGIVKPRTVGVFARGRKTYGRNLPSEFYVKLINLLEQMGYQVIWLGEAQSTQSCPVKHVFDFSRTPESRDLERTLAIICNLDFTVQFWTASSRLAGMMGIPYLLFESPEQIYASKTGVMGAQEGKRLELTTFGPKKVVMAHYKKAIHDQDGLLRLVRQAIEEMGEGNYSDLFGMVENHWFTENVLQKEYYELLR